MEANPRKKNHQFFKPVMMNIRKYYEEIKLKTKKKLTPCTHLPLTQTDTPM